VLRSLSIDLKTLLERVMVPPAASARFLRVVADLVQRITDAPVFRASGLRCHPKNQ